MYSPDRDSRLSCLSVSVRAVRASVWRQLVVGRIKARYAQNRTMKGMMMQPNEARKKKRMARMERGPGTAKARAISESE